MNDEQKWRAVLARDREADGAFVYGVRSTGIYCRPSCPSRRPGRAQVIFFAQPEDAEQGGFRSCRRCHPRDGAAHERQPDWVAEACRFIESRIDEPPSLEEISAHVNVSLFHFQRTFKRATGVSPREYAEARRTERLKARLKEDESVTTALYDSGYGSSSRLYERAPAQLGMTPAAYRHGGAGACIHFSIVDSPLGRLSVAATAKGICFVSLGDDDASLLAALRKEYPAAQIESDGKELAPWVRAIVAYVSGQHLPLDLPLDVQATAFQRRVWRELQAIPYGSTRTYADIAQRLGQPNAVRAVSRACATNPVALVVPCHRVIRTDGSLAGYRWGLARKAKLLEQERNGAK